MDAQNNMQVTTVRRGAAVLPSFTHEQILSDPQTFWSALQRFHAAFGTSIQTPVIGGKEVDLHRLYAEVTKRGGVHQVVESMKWREIGITVFQFPPTITSASYALRKYYMNMLYHFEQYYFFNVKEPYIKQALPVPLCVEEAPVPPTTPVTCPAKPHNGASSSKTPIGAQEPHPQGTPLQNERTPEPNEVKKDSTLLLKLSGKIEEGYIVQVKVGSDILPGFLYHPMESESSTPAPPSTTTAMVPYNPRRVSQDKKRKHRDPDHPKPNCSAYNFFFAAKYAELKALIPERERDFVKMIGEAWKSLSEEHRLVYNESGKKDKERYKRAMVEYKERKAKALKGSDEGPSK